MSAFVGSDAGEARNCLEEFRSEAKATVPGAEIAEVSPKQNLRQCDDVMQAPIHDSDDRRKKPASVRENGILFQANPRQSLPRFRRLSRSVRGGEAFVQPLGNGTQRLGREGLLNEGVLRRQSSAGMLKQVIEAFEP